MKYLDNLDNFLKELKRTKKKRQKKKVFKKIQIYIDKQNKACVQNMMDNIHKAFKTKDTSIDLIQYHNDLISGKFIRATLLEGFNCIGFERDENYFNIVKARLENTTPFIKDLLKE